MDNGGKWDEFDQKTGRTPLMLSIELNAWELVKLLLDRGASAQTALGHATIVNAWDIVRALLKQIRPGTVSVDSTVFARALEGCTDASIIKGLLDLGAPIHGEFFGLNPLYSATVHGGSPEVVRLLLDHGAKLEQSSGDRGSPLANAIHNGQLETSKLLLEAGEQLYKDPEKKTKKELKLEGLIRDEESKPNPDKELIEMHTYFLEHERTQKPRAPIYSFDHPWKKFPPNFKKDLIAYAAKLGQKPPEG